MNKRLNSIIMGIDEAIEHRGLDLYFECDFEDGVLLYNYKPNFEKGYDHEECCSDVYPKVYICGHESDKCITI